MEAKPLSPVVLEIIIGKDILEDETIHDTLYCDSYSTVDIEKELKNKYPKWLAYKIIG